MEDLYEHQRNESNCPLLQERKCFIFKNVTACFCSRKPISPPDNIPHRHCPPRFYYRCKYELNFQRSCGCTRIGPIKVNGTIKIKPIIKSSFSEPLKPIESLKPLEPIMPNF